MRFSSRIRLPRLVCAVLCFATAAIAVVESQGQTTSAGSSAGQVRPPYDVEVAGRTRTSLILRWRMPPGATRVTLHLNRRPIASTAATKFAFTGLRCNTRVVVGVSIPGSRVSGAGGRTLPCTSARRAAPAFALKVAARTRSTVTLRWRMPHGVRTKTNLYVNRRFIGRTPRTNFMFRRLACGRRTLIGIQRPGSRIVATSAVTLPCLGGGAGTGPAAAPPGLVPVTPGGVGLPARIPLSTGQVFHVATTGQDGNNGSAAAPWRTIGKALATLSAGQSAIVRGGTYNESLSVNRGGTADAPITIRNAPGESVVVNATGEEALELLGGARYLRFQGLIFQGANGSSSTNVYATGGANHIELFACEIRGSQRQGLFSDANTDSLYIIGCNIHDNGGSGPSSRDHNLYIEGNNHVVTSNLIRGAPNGYGIQLYPSSANVVISGNTIVDNSRGGVIVGGEGSPTRGARIMGNILAFNRGPGLSTYWTGPTGSDNLVRTNLTWGNSGGSIIGNGITNQGEINADPLFVNRPGGNFTVAANSPALGRAEAAFTSGTDVLGTARPQGSGADIGAYER